MGNYARFNALFGPARTKELIFTARLWARKRRDQTASSLTCPVSRQLDEARQELAITVVAQAPLTFAPKEALRRLAAQAPSGDDVIAMWYTSGDFRERMSVFLDNRSPSWKGAVIKTRSPALSRVVPAARGDPKVALGSFCKFARMRDGSDDPGTTMVLAER
jgi:hypothetical protein